MAVVLTKIQDAIDHGYDTVIDVRSPAEFAEDHIPGAISLPALDDDERAQVGTIYKQQSPFQARVVGAALVAQNTARHLQGPLADKAGDWRPLVYCWRGGQRSGSFASILNQIGWRADVIDGGYRSFRRLVVAALHDNPLPFRLVLLDGNTGTGKTDLLHELQSMDVQTLDLEGLARHRGSVFGAMAGGQPPQKSFETALATSLSAFDPGRSVLLEAESSKIGCLNIPPSLWKAMIAAPRIRVTASVPSRADYLVRRYHDVVEDRPRLNQILDDLIPYHGREKVADWKALAGDGFLNELAGELMRSHYDLRYSRSRARSDAPLLAEISMEDLLPTTLKATAGRIADVLVAAAHNPVQTN